MNIKRPLFRLLYIFSALVHAYPSLSGAAETTPLQIKLNSWTAEINPRTLQIVADSAGKKITLANPLAADHEPLNLVSDAKHISWKYADASLALDVRITADETSSRLKITVTSDRESTFVWPTTGQGAGATALIYPQSEGLYIPLADPTWSKQVKNAGTDGLCNGTQGGLSIPVWGYQLDKGTIAYIVPNDLQSSLCLKTASHQIYTELHHEFRKRDGFSTLELLISINENSPIAPALDYRRYLQSTGQFVSLQKKIDFNAEAGKLPGATHAYLWGDGTSVEALVQLKALGFDKMMLVYDPNAFGPKGELKYGPDYPNEKYGPDDITPVIKKAVESGYLIGPYDIFNTAQSMKRKEPPGEIGSAWDQNLFDNGCVMIEKGGHLVPKPGFGGIGCELSSQALVQAEPTYHYLANRIGKYLKLNVNGYFLDADGAGDAWDDLSLTHPMTPQVDQKNRLDRMALLSRDHKIVLGTEEAVGWSTPVVHFSHGREIITSDPFWEFLGDEKRMGGWGPAGRADIFFREVPLDPLLKAMGFNPATRLPLMQAVFHDSIVTLDRWEFSPVKIKGLVQTRALLRFLYGVPALWNLDRKQISKYSEMLKAENSVFSPLHQQIATLPLMDFRWLTSDHLVQQTRFGDEVEVIANFSPAKWQNIPLNCMQITWVKGSKQPLIYCPKSS